MKKNNILKLFQMRDKGVNENKRELFLSAYLAEIAMFHASGYINREYTQKTEVLKLDPDNETSLSEVVFVKETYFLRKNGEEYSQADIIYYVVNTIKGWRIYNLVHSSI